MALASAFGALTASVEAPSRIPTLGHSKPREDGSVPVAVTRGFGPAKKLPRRSLSELEPVEAADAEADAFDDASWPNQLLLDEHPATSTALSSQAAARVPKKRRAHALGVQKIPIIVPVPGVVGAL